MLAALCLTLTAACVALTWLAHRRTWERNAFRADRDGLSITLSAELDKSWILRDQRDAAYRQVDDLRAALKATPFNGATTHTFTTGSGNVTTGFALPLPLPANHPQKAPKRKPARKRKPKP